GRIVQSYASYGYQGHIQRLTSLHKQAERGVRSIGLGPGWEKAAKGHVVCPRPDSGLGQVKGCVAGNADNGVRSQAPPGLPGVRIGLAKMHTMGSRSQCQVQIVIDQKLGAVVVAQFEQSVYLSS